MNISKVQSHTVHDMIVRFGINEDVFTPATIYNYFLFTHILPYQRKQLIRSGILIRKHILPTSVSNYLNPIGHPPPEGA